MGLITELRARLRHAIGPLIGTLLVVYFGYHLIHGDRGLLAWWDVRQGIAESRAVLGELQAERTKLDHRVGLLRSEGLDPDLLDERARHVLNVGRDDEIVILPPAPEAPAAMQPSRP